MDQTYSETDVTMPPPSPIARPDAIHAGQLPVIANVKHCLPPDQSLSPDVHRCRGVGNTESRHSIPGVQTAASMLPDLANAPRVNMAKIDYKQISDEQLLQAARDSDRHAFGELSSRYAKSIRKTVARIVRNDADADDVVQEALVKAYIHLKNFRGTCSFSSWLTRIAINLSLMLLRRRRTRSEVPFDPQGDEDRTWEIRDFPDPSPNPEQIYAKDQMRELLTRTVTRLPQASRRIMTQYHYHERPLKDIAETVGISVPATKSRLLRARLAMRAALGEVIPAPNTRH